MRLRDYRSCVTETTVVAPGRRTIRLRLARDVPADLHLVDRRRHARDTLPDLALQPCQVQVLRHVPPLLDDLVRRHDEVVRIEVAADVGVGEEPRMGRITRLLEAVELDAADRVDVAELVGEEDPAARSRHARDLAHDELGAADVVEHPEAPDEVEVAVGEGERLRVPGDERAARRGVLTRDGEVLLGGVDADHPADEGRERVRERAGAATDVEDALVPAQRGEEPPDTRDELVVALRLERSPVLGPVAHPTTLRVVLAGSTRIPHASSYPIVSATSAWASRVAPSPTSTTAAPTAVGPGRRTASASIEIVPTTGTRAPSTMTSVRVRSRRKPSAYPTGTIPIQVSDSATNRRP